MDHDDADFDSIQWDLLAIARYDRRIRWLVVAIIGTYFGLLLTLFAVESAWLFLAFGLGHLTALGVAAATILGLGRALHAHPVWLILNVLCTVCAPVIGVFVMIDASMRARRILDSVEYCPACGYDLRGSPERCPECGHQQE